MKKYKVLVEFTLDETVHAVDSVVELSDEVATPLVEQGNLVVAEDSTSPSPENAG